MYTGHLSSTLVHILGDDRIDFLVKLLDPLFQARLFSFGNFLVSQFCDTDASGPVLLPNTAIFCPGETLKISGQFTGIRALT